MILIALLPLSINAATIAYTKDDCKDAPRPYWGACENAIESGKAYNWGKIFSGSTESSVKQNQHKDSIVENQDYTEKKSHKEIALTNQQKDSIKSNPPSKNEQTYVDSESIKKISKFSEDQASQSYRQSNALENIDFDLKLISGIGILWSIVGIVALLTVK